jgi:hypothetical protein
MGKILKEISPVAYHTCLNIHNAALEDWQLIPVVFDTVAKKYEPSISTFHNFLGVLYNRFTPWKYTRLAQSLMLSLEII